MTAKKIFDPLEISYAYSVLRNECHQCIWHPPAPRASWKIKRYKMLIVFYWIMTLFALSLIPVSHMLQFIWGFLIALYFRTKYEDVEQFERNDK